MSKRLPKKIIIDAQFSLMLFEEAFAEPLFILAKSNRDYFIKHISWITKINTLEDELNFIHHCDVEYQAGLSAHYALIINDVEIVGSIGFSRITNIGPNKDEAIIGYWLSPTFQGKGYMQKSLSALIETAIKTTDIRAFVIKTSIHNIKSINLAEKNNFQFFKAEPNGLRIEDKYVDLAIYRKEYLPA